MSKKGQGMSLNVVIIAALALIVLVVLTAIFVGRLNTASEKTNENDELAYSRICVQPRDGYTDVKCVNQGECDEDPWQVIRPASGSSSGAGSWMDCDTDDGKVCCGAVER
ncbi:MAG: hypothetical protein R6V50_01705 [Thermoplasmatota archaeon]